MIYNYACLPLGMDNFTTTASPTTTFLTTEANQSGAIQLAIFGGLIIMIRYVLFM